MRKNTLEHLVFASVTKRRPLVSSYVRCVASSFTDRAALTSLEQPVFGSLSDLFLQTLSVQRHQKAKLASPYAEG